MAKAGEMTLQCGGRFGTAFYKALNENNLPLVEFARKVGQNYEYMRKVVRGLNTPSKLLLPVLCNALHLDHEQMTVLVMEDFLVKKYGEKAVASFKGQNAPHSSEFLELLLNLSEGQIAG